MDTVLVTGANRGLGLELAAQYAADGWRVLACARRFSVELETLANASPGVTMLSLDVTDHRQVDHLATELAGEAIDVLINNAGVLGKRGFDQGAGRDQSFGHSDFADWERIFRTNVIGPMKMAEAFIEQVARSRQRKIVTLSSIVGSMTLNRSGGLYAYRASKAAVNAVMKSMSIDLSRRNILAVALHPGWARTEMGGRNATLDVTESVSGMRRVIADLGQEHLGRLLSYDGSELDY